ncbi:MAG: hypothetical protein WD691_11030 [Acidimicrobiales bacterium]
MPALESPARARPTPEEPVTMETTHTKAGLLADAGAARLRAVAPLASCPAAAALGVDYGTGAQHVVSGNHPSATWTKGAIAKPVTFMVFDSKNRPTRPLLEHSP